MAHVHLLNSAGRAVWFRRSLDHRIGVKPATRTGVALTLSLIVVLIALTFAMLAGVTLTGSALWVVAPLAVAMAAFTGFVVLVRRHLP